MALPVTECLPASKQPRVDLSHFPQRAQDRGHLDFQTFDHAYVERLRSGDEETEAHFFRYFRELIRLKLRSRFHSSEAIDDVCQETFARCLTLLRSDGGLRQPDRLGAVVNSICNNVVSEQYRKADRIEPLDEHAPERFVEPRPDALTQVITAETVQVVREVLAGLPNRDRRVLQAMFLQEREKDEVCRELGVSRDYIRVLLHRAKQSFRDQYNKREAVRR